MSVDNSIPPNDVVSEQRLIGCMILRADAIDTASAILRSHYFYYDLYAGIFSTLVRLRSTGELPDDGEGAHLNQNAILEEFDRLEIGTQVTGGLSSLVADLVDIPHAGHVHYYAGKVREKWQLRTRTQKLDDLARIGRQSTTSPDEIISKLEEISTLLAVTSHDDDLSISARQLDEADIVCEYLAPGLLAARQFCLLAGPSKGCKTTSLCDIALSLSTGAKIFNEFYVTRAYRVGFISAESGQAVLQETLRRIAWSKPIKNLGDYENLRIDFRIWKLSEPGTIRRLIQWVKKHRLEVLILDPFYLMAGLSEDASNMFIVGRLLADLQAVGNETGVTIILAHHFKKLSTFDQYNSPELGMVAWSGFEQYARQWLLLNRREAYDPDSGLHRLWLSAGGSAGHGGLFAIDAVEGRLTDQGGRRWEVVVHKASEARKAEKEEREQRREAEQQESLSKNAEKVLDKLEANPEGLTRSGLRDLTGISLPKLTPILATLIERAMVATCKVTSTNGQNYDGFRFVTRTPVQPSVHAVRMNDTDGAAHTSVLPSPYRDGTSTGVVCASDAHVSSVESLYGCPDLDQVPEFGGRPA